MTIKLMVVGFALLTLWVSTARDPFQRGTPVQPSRRAQVAGVATAVVLVDSLQVISYIDSAGVAHPADSTLIPPVPLSGVSEFKIILDREQPLAKTITSRDADR